MTKNPAKDFAPIAEDYAFFETHSTEAEQDGRAYLERLAGIMPAAGTIQMLDFGCGSGTFTARFLQQAGWPRSQLRLTLVEPVESARQQAVARLAGCSERPIVDWAALPREMTGTFDVTVANHVLYYVPALQKRHETDRQTDLGPDARCRGGRRRDSAGSREMVKDFAPGAVYNEEEHRCPISRTPD